MRVLFNESVFDQEIIGTTPVYSSPFFDALLGVADEFALEITCQVVGGDGAWIRVDLEHCNDGMHWVACIGLVPPTALSTSATTAIVAAYDGSVPLAAYARLKLTLSGTSPRATIRLGTAGSNQWRESGVVWEADFSGLTPGTLATLPGGLSFSRSSAATVQTSATTLLTAGIANDVARVGDDGTHSGLVFEETRTNVTPTSREPTSASWNGASLTTVTRPSGTAPDGDLTTATQYNTSSTGYGRYVACGVTVGPSWTLSCWGRTKNLGAAWQMESDLAIKAAAITNSTTTGWFRRTWTRTFTTSVNWVPVDARDWSAYGGITATAVDIYIDLFQVELGGFATEAIVNSGGGTTARAGEKLWHPTGSTLVQNSRLGLEFRLQPKGGNADYTSDMYLWYADGSNYARISKSAYTVTVAVAGVTYTTPVAMAWSAGDVLEVWMAVGASAATIVKYRVNGGVPTTLTTGSPTAFGAPTVSTTLDLLCFGATSQFSAWVQRIRAYNGSTAPGWAE